VTQRPARASWARIVAGLAAGPLALASGAALLLLLDRAVDAAAALSSAGTLLGIALPVALLLGLPAHLVLAGAGTRRLLPYAVAGAALGAVSADAFMAPFGATLASRATAAAAGAAAGAFAAALFWSIAVRGRPLPNRHLR
jgi:hypothetical protein